MNLNTQRAEQNVWHFEDHIFKCMCLKEKFCILILISLKTVPTDPVDNMSALVLLKYAEIEINSKFCHFGWDYI